MALSLLASSRPFRRSRLAMPEFKIGDKAVYPAHGVAEVVGVENKEINSQICSF